MTSEQEFNDAMSDLAKAETEVERATKYATAWESAAKDLGAKCQRREIEIERQKVEIKSFYEELCEARAEVERLTAERANRYWEGRYRDEKAEVERLRAELIVISKGEWTDTPQAHAYRALEDKL
jgi:hypothetical protein